MEREGFFRRVARAFSPRSREASPQQSRSDGLTTEQYVSDLIRKQIRSNARSVRVGDPFEQSGAVYRAVFAVAGALSSAPLEAWKGPDRKTGKLVESGRLPELLKRPNRLMTQREWKFMVAAQVMLFRHCDVLVREGRVSGQVAELIPLAPGSITPIRPKSDPYDLTGWSFRYFGHYDILRPDQIIRFRYAVHPTDPLKGVNPFLTVSDVIDTDYAATLYNKSALESGGSFGGIVQIEPPPGEEVEDIDDETAAEIRRRIDERLHGGPEAAERIAILTARMKYIPVGKAAKDLQFIEGKALNVKEIARAAGIPPLFMNEFEGIGLGHEGLTTQYQMLYHNAVFPLATGIEECLTEGVAKRFDEDVRIIHNWDGVDALKEDAKSRLERAQLMKALDVSRNEINDILDLGLPKTPEGDVVLVPAGMIPKKMAVEGIGFDFEPSEPEATDTPAPKADPAQPTKEEPKDLETSKETVLNGAQIQAALEIVKAVAMGDLPRDSGIGLLMTLFNLSQEQAEAMMGSAGTSTPTTPNPKPVQPGPEAPPLPPGRETASLDLHLHRNDVEARRARMWRLHVKNVKPYERRLLKEIRANLKAQMPKVVDSVTERGIAPEHTRDAKTSSEVFDPEAFAEALRKAILATHIAGAKGAGRELLDLGLVTDAVLEAETDRLPQLAEQYFDARKEMVVDVGDRIREEIRQALLEGYRTGENLSDLKDRVREVFDYNLKQARTIARTEAHTAVNNGRVTLMRRQGVEKHEWLSSRDEHVRPSHQIDGERVVVGERFSNGTRFPGDPDAPPEESCNCRCTTVPVAEDFEAFEEETSQASSLDREDLWSRNLARRALHLGVATPSVAIARRIPGLLAEQSHDHRDGAEALRSMIPDLIHNPAVSGAVQMLGGTVFASLWLHAWHAPPSSSSTPTEDRHVAAEL